MVTAVEKFKFVLSLLTGLSGTMSNSLLLTLYLLQWKKSRNSVVRDQIQMSTALSNIFLQVCLSFDSIPGTHEIIFNLGKKLFVPLMTLQFSFFHASVWNTTWLSMFYFVRLVNFSHPYLLRMKATFLSSVPQLIVGSVLGSIVINLPLFWVTEANPIKNGTLTITGAYEININVIYAVFTSFFGSLLPTTLTCLCIGQCVTSLLRHVCRINLGESHLTSSQLQGHIRATSIMIMRLVLDLTCYLVNTVGMLTSFKVHDNIKMFFWLIMMMYPTFQSLILIYGNPKLKSKLCRRCVFD